MLSRCVALMPFDATLSTSSPEVVSVSSLFALVVIEEVVVVVLLPLQLLLLLLLLML